MNYALYYYKDIAQIAFEPGVRAIYWFCQTLFETAQSFFVLAAVLTFIPLCFVVKKEYFFHVLFFYNLGFCYLDSYNIVRQALAVPYLICAAQFFIDKSYRKGLIYGIIACLFHNSSYFVFLLILIALLPMRYDVRNFVTLVLSFFIFVLNFASIIYAIVNQIFPRFAGYFVGEIFKQRGSGFAVLFRMLLPLYILCMGKFIKNGYLLNLNSFYFLYLILVLKLPIVSRLQNSLFLVPMISANKMLYVNFKYRRVIYYLFTVFYFIIYMRSLTSAISGTPTSGVLPYISIFSSAS